MSALALVLEHRPRGAHNGLHASLAGGTLHPPAPAICLLDGLPPRRLRRQGRCGTRCAPFLASLRDRLRRPSTRPSSRRPGETRSPGAGEDLSPTSRQGGDSSMRGCGCLIAALVGLFLGLYIAGSLLTAALH